MPEGYVEPSNLDTYDYVYQYKDHLDNVRLSYKGNEDLLFYDSFESASGWDGSGHIGSDPVSSFDSNFKRTGDYSALLEPSQSGSLTSYCYHNDWVAINNTQATSYTFSAWVYAPRISVVLILPDYA